MKGEFDLKVFEPFRKVLTPGGIFLDVGANVGYYSLLALELVGQEGSVHTFEIDDRALRCLFKTIRRNNLKNIHVHRVAVGNITGKVSIIMCRECGHSRIDPNGPGPIMPMDTLDNLSVNFKAKVQGLKIDVEGSELNALKGGEKLLRTHRPLVVCEAHEETLDRYGYTVRDLFQFLEDIGYKVDWLDGTCTPTIVAYPR